MTSGRSSITHPEMASTDDSASGLSADPNMGTQAVAPGGLLRPAGLPMADATESLQPPATLRGLSQGTLILLAVAFIAAAAIYVMRITQGSIAAGQEIAVIEAKIEQALARLGQTPMAESPASEDAKVWQLNDTQAIVAMFTDDVSRRQIPPNRLRSNPFSPKVMAPAPVEADASVSSPAPATTGVTPAELAKLKLEAVVHGRVPVAIINGSLYQVGQHVGSLRIRAIKGMEVELEADGQVHVIRIDRSLNRLQSK